MTVTLKLKKQPEFYLETDCISPDQFAGKSVEEIKQMKVFYANQEVKLSEWFEITDVPPKIASEVEIIILGNCSLVQRIGEKMSAGKITIKGDCGMHVGSCMTGGKILVEGNAAEWAGAMMDGGELEIMKDAGNHCAAAYRGNWVGMNSGKIIVHGKVGMESGSWMRATKSRNKYPILECGSADMYLGVHNHGGTIICHGDAAPRAGGDMNEGIIIVEGKAKEILPSFKKDQQVTEIQAPNGIIKGKFVDYLGDCAVNEKPLGHLYVAMK
jgi:formylmethanofuran dehydrogenase subunit C